MYIGMTQQLVKDRWSRGYGYKNQKVVFQAITEVGWENIEHIILYEDIPYDKGKKIENYLIRFFKTNNPKYGYNIKEGDNTFPMAESTKLKLSATRKKMFQEHPEKRVSYTKGTKHSEESKRKTSESMKKYCREHPERAKKHSEQLRGRKMAYKEHPKAYKKIICIETGIVYESLKEASSKLNIPQGSLSHCLHGDYHTAGGFHFEFYKEKEDE